MRATAMTKIHELAQRDPRVVFIGSDLGAGTLSAMQKEMPERFFMEGVSEQHIIGMAAGLAMEGYVPYINTIGTFLTRRCFEQIAIDVCLHDLPVRLIASGGGAVYAPLGPTHMAVEDLAILRTLPNMAVCAPVDADEMGRLMDASLAWPGPLYVRVAKGGDPIVSRGDLDFAIGRAISMRAGGEIGLIATGVMTARALAAADLLARDGTSASVLHAHTVKPLDADAVCDLARNVRLLVTIEEHTLIGGLGGAVVELLADREIAVPVLRLGFADAFSHTYGSQEAVLAEAGLTPEGIAASVAARLSSVR